MKTLCLVACATVLSALSSSTVYGFALNAVGLTSEAITEYTMAEAATPATNLVQAPDFFSNMLQNKYAGMIQALPEDISNINLYSFIDQWYGTRYLWGGTTKDGVDCSALVQNMYREVFKKDIVRTSIMQYGMSMVLPQKDSLREGDLVFFKTRGNFISHVGVYLKNDYFVHSSSSRGVAISNLDENYWSKVYAAAGRIEAPNEMLAQN